MKERCLQQTLGSCTGCPIREIAISKINAVALGQRQAKISRIKKQYCPEGTEMQPPRKQKQSIW